MNICDNCKNGIYSGYDHPECADALAKEKAAFQWATANQGFDGDFSAWLDLDDDVRAEYEQGAAGKHKHERE